MPAWKPGGLFGLKTVMIFLATARAACPGCIRSTLFDASTGVPLAQLDGNEITARRTAAAAALAASFLAREDATRLLVLGCGRVARLLPAAMHCVRPGSRACRCGTTGRGRDRAGARVARTGYRCAGRDGSRRGGARGRHRQLRHARHARRWCAARGRAGTHLDLIGSFTPQMRECDAACFARSRVFVDTEEALAKSGDVLGGRRGRVRGSAAAGHAGAAGARRARRPPRGRRDHALQGGGQRARKTSPLQNSWPPLCSADEPYAPHHPASGGKTSPAGSVREFGAAGDARRRHRLRRRVRSAALPPRRRSGRGLAVRPARPAAGTPAR